MATFTITTTEAQDICLKNVMGNPQDWSQNAIDVRAKSAGDKIITNLISHCNANEIAIPVGRDAQIIKADELNLVYDVSNNERPTDD
ncbi:hypothetical protein N9J19_00085 [bacterium]|nr:hypothetical protein [bacterium]